MADHMPVSPQPAGEAYQGRTAAPDGGAKSLGAQRGCAQCDVVISICCGRKAMGQGVFRGSELPVTRSRRARVRPPAVDVVKENPVQGGLLRDTSVVSAYLEIPQHSCSQSSENG